ncbi:MAG: DNA polymerase IV [Alphaproteobacteria bacterium]
MQVNSAPVGFCRDCLTRTAEGRGRCAACGSPRVMRHEELFELTIAHLDCDAFYAAIEKRDDPDLRDRPLIVGGGRRGVVSTACYIARTYGVGSAMPMFKALKACPDAVVLRPDMAKYQAVSREVRRLMEDMTPLVQPLSLDEAFLDLTGTERLHGASAAETLARLLRRIETEIGITASAGLSHNKFLAKLASDMDKPRGFSVIGRAETEAVLAPLPVSRIWGVGARLEARLAEQGITHIRHLQTMDETDLMRRYGVMGRRLVRLARGEDERPVDADSETKSISSETTFETDISDPVRLRALLWEQCERVSARAKSAGLAGRTVTLKLKTDRFRTVTRSRTLGRSTQLAARIFECGRDLLDREADGRRFRLLGIGISGLTAAGTADGADLLDPQGERRTAAERAMDAIRGRFGTGAIGLGRGLGRRGRRTGRG